MRQGPIVEELAEEGYAVGKLDVDQNMEIAQQFRVMSIPTLTFLRTGRGTSSGWPDRQRRFKEASG